ncbi:MAG: EF2563 family selenium-dependent molybdenum hydroxylase system protein [Candidatus Tectomicrobia bacterium]|nr:EF2563 family selenium-dependent molybdenum hydroxylase system protein [Candidatus Tectomicrobia bacterium]
MTSIPECKVFIRGAGEQASGVGHRLARCGFHVCMAEVARPLAVRREVAFCEAVLDGTKTVEGIEGILAHSVADVTETWRRRRIAVVVDPECSLCAELRPHVVVDAILAKRNIGTHMKLAPLVIGLGPGFTAGMDVHAVVETNRGHDLGRVILSGSAEPDTGVPGSIGGYSIERVLRSPCAGHLKAVRHIGDAVAAGEVICTVNGNIVNTTISGVLRGLLRDDLVVPAGFKLGDVDPRAAREACFTISDKARAIGGGVLEAILMHLYGIRSVGAPQPAGMEAGKPQAAPTRGGVTGASPSRTAS